MFEVFLICEHKLDNTEDRYAVAILNMYVELSVDTQKYFNNAMH